MTISIARNVPVQSGRPPTLVAPPQEVKVPTARRWQHQYSRWLRITDALIVCAAVALARFVALTCNGFAFIRNAGCA